MSTNFPLSPAIFKNTISKDGTGARIISKINRPASRIPARNTSRIHGGIAVTFRIIKSYSIPDSKPCQNRIAPHIPEDKRAAGLPTPEIPNIFAINHRLGNHIRILRIQTANRNGFAVHGNIRLSIQTRMNQNSITGP